MAITNLTVGKFDSWCQKIFDKTVQNHILRIDFNENRFSTT